MEETGIVITYIDEIVFEEVGHGAGHKTEAVQDVEEVGKGSEAGADTDLHQKLPHQYAEHTHVCYLGYNVSSP